MAASFVPVLMTTCTAQHMLQMLNTVGRPSLHAARTACNRANKQPACLQAGAYNPASGIAEAAPGMAEAAPGTAEAAPAAQVNIPVVPLRETGRLSAATPVRYPRLG